MRTLRVRLLGALQVEGCEPKALGRRQVRTLLKILALARCQPVSSDRLADCLWRDEPPARPANQLSVLASRLRAVVGADRVRQSDAGYTLLVDWLDVVALEEYAAEADSRRADGAFAAARAAAAAGLSLLRGPLCADEHDAPWVELERSAVDRLVNRLVETAASTALATGDWTGAADLAERMLAADPFDEAGLRILMESLAGSGRPASALAAYATTRGRLADELGVSPSPPTEALHEAILLGERRFDAAAETPVMARREHLPGRAASIAALDDLLDVAASGHGQVAMIEGEAGIGKSRLLEVWSAHAGDRARVVSVSCDELGRSLPLQPLLDAVGVLLRDPEAGRPDALLGPDIGVLGPLVGVLSEPADPTQLAALTDPGAGQSLLFAALFGVLRRQSENRALVLIIDDLHLADAATTAWVGQASRSLAGAPVMVVGSRRIEEAVPIRGVSTVSLGPLDLPAVTEIVGPERAPALLRRSGGHPLFLVELAAADKDVELPTTIRASVEDRCARAGPASTTLRIAATIGPQVDLDVLSAVTGDPSGRLLDHLEEGVRRRLLKEAGPGFAFTHGLVREALASSVSSSRAAYVHRQAARALGARPDADPLVVARHARLGGERAQASSLLVEAARLAVARFHYEDSLHLLDEAIALHDTATARLDRARVHSMLARHDLATADLRAATGLGAGTEALEVAAWSAHYQRRFDDALTLADRGAGEATDPELRASCLALGGWISLSTGDLVGAESRLERAVVSTPVGPGRLANTWLGWLRTYQSRPEESLRLVRLEPGTGLASYRFPNAYAQMAATMALATLGRVDEAMETLDAFSADVARMGADRWTARPINLRGWIVRNLGAFSEADELNQVAIEAARSIGMAEPLANGLLDLAAGRLLADDFDAATALLDEADEVSAVQHAFRWRHRLRGRLLRARLDLALGATERALATSDELAGEAAGLGLPRYEVQARLVGSLARHQGSDRVELGDIDILLSKLGDVAGLEAWWITAQIARTFGVEAWEQLARRRTATLARVAGPYAPSLERWAGRLIV